LRSVNRHLLALWDLTLLQLHGPSLFAAEKLISVPGEKQDCSPWLADGSPRQSAVRFDPSRQMTIGCPTAYLES
jgi:hypothetical protein